MMAGHVTKFNEALQNYKRDFQIQFLPAAHLQLITPYGGLETVSMSNHTFTETS